MKAVNTIIRKALQAEIRKGKNQTELGIICQMSQGNIGKYLHGDPDPEIDTLRKFSTGLGIPLSVLVSAESTPEYVRPTEDKSLRHEVRQLMATAVQLDDEALATLQRCAEAFQIQDGEVRQHLIGQLKLIERLVKPSHGKGARADPRNLPGKASG